MGIVALLSDHDPGRIQSGPLFQEYGPGRVNMVDTDRPLGGSATLEFVVRTEPGGLKDPAVLSDGAIGGVGEVEGGEIQSPLELVEEAHRVFVDGTGIPETSEMVAQLFLILEGEPEDFEAMVQGDYDIGRVSARTRLAVDAPLKDRKKQLDKVVERVQQPGKFDVQMTVFSIDDGCGTVFVRGKFELSALGSSVASFMLLGSFRLIALPDSQSHPIAFGLAFMGIAGINLDSTVMIGPIALGLVVDDCVHFLFRYRGLVRQGLTVERPAARPSIALGGHCDDESGPER